MSINTSIEKLITEISPDISLLEFHRISSVQTDLNCAIGFKIGNKWVYGEDLPSTPYKEIAGDVEQMRIRLIEEELSVFSVPTQFNVKPEVFSFTLIELAREAREANDMQADDFDAEAGSNFEELDFMSSMDGEGVNMHY